MSFDTFDPRMKSIAERAVVHCRQKFGGNGLVLEQGISPNISWRPTFYCKPTPMLIVAVEVADNLYPEVLKGAAHDISFFDTPIAVYQTCSLDSYQQDVKQSKINKLREHGFGIITVDDDGLTVVQHPAVPLAQHIPGEQLEDDIRPLTSKLKVAFRTAHTTYSTNIGQGLQQAGQVVEAMVTSLAKQAAKDGAISNAASRGAIAAVIDALYVAPKLKDYRAELGAARAFLKEYRNTASHPAKSAKQAALKMRSCKAGFTDAINTATKLQRIFKLVGYKLTTHIT